MKTRCATIDLAKVEIVKADKLKDVGFSPLTNAVVFATGTVEQRFFFSFGGPKLVTTAPPSIVMQLPPLTWEFEPKGEVTHFGDALPQVGQFFFDSDGKFGVFVRATESRATYMDVRTGKIALFDSYVAALYSQWKLHGFSDASHDKPLITIDNSEE